MSRLVEAFLKAFIKRGDLGVRTADGRTFVCGDGDGPMRAGAPEAILTMHVPELCAEEAWVRAPPVGEAAAAPPPPPPDSPAQAPHGGLRVDVGGSASAPGTAPGAAPGLVRVSGTRIRLRLAPFSRCGFMDWRVVIVLRDGSTRPVTAEPTFAPPPQMAAATAAATGVAGGGGGVSRGCQRRRD